MFDVITSFLGSISDMLTLMWDMLIEYATSINDVRVILGTIMARIPVFFRWLPGELIAILWAMFSIAILYKVLGRS